MSLTKLKEIIFDRIPVEILLAHEALGIYMVIAKESGSLKRSKKRQLFGILQRQALGTFILSLCNLFEKPNEKYPNYSIRTALLNFHSVLNDVAVPEQSMVKLDEYIRAEIDSTFSVYHPIKAEAASSVVCTHFEEHCPRTPPRQERKLDLILDALKVLRDRVIVKCCV